MKKLLIILAFLTFGIASAQGPWRGFFEPVPYDLIKSNDKEAVTTSVWLFRPMLQLTAIQFTYDKAAKVFNTSALQSAGMGVGYQHFIEANGEPYNDFGFNAVMLFDIVPTETTSTGIGAAVTVNAFKIISAGVGYNFTKEKMFILTGVIYNF